MKYPGIDHIDDRHIFRSVGNRESGGQLGFGFIHKKGKSTDEEDAIFRTYSIVYVIRGRGSYIDDSGNRYPLTPGSLFQRFPGIRHSTYIEPESDWAECYMDLGVNVYDLLLSLNIIDRKVPVLQNSSDAFIEREIYSYFERLKKCREYQLPDLMIDSIKLLRSMLNRNFESEGSRLQSKIIEQSCSDFTGNFQKRFDLREYCFSRGLGYETFRKNFKKEIGMSPGKYIVRRRIDMACQILIASQKSVGEIAYELGYRSQYEFSAQFKRLIGVSPNNYRPRK